MNSTDFMIGYGKGEIEPRIAPLVAAVRKAGFVTFSSCEGHPEDAADCLRTTRTTCVSFYANEAAAKRVHESLLHYTGRLACSWGFTASFVLQWGTDVWVLGWTLENWGIIEATEPSEFSARTMNAAWGIDIPILIEMFDDMIGGEIPIEPRAIVSP
jgi:hypothetical protein